VKKTYELARDQADLKCSYEITSDAPLDVIFAVESSLAFPGTDPKLWNYRFKNGDNAGNLEGRYSFDQRDEIGVADRLKGTDIALRYSRPADLWLFPIRTVSQSECGFEGVFQSSVIVARWPLHLEPRRPWQVCATKAIADI
jgi:hypothetical protein